MTEVCEAREVFGANSLTKIIVHCTGRDPPTTTTTLLKQLGYFLLQFVLALSEYCRREMWLVKYSSVGVFALSRMSSFHTEPPDPNYIPGMDCFGSPCACAHRCRRCYYVALMSYLVRKKHTFSQNKCSLKHFPNCICFPPVLVHVTNMTVEKQESAQPLYW